MQLTAANLDSAISAIEADLGVRYPVNASQFLADLSAIVGTPQHHGLFKDARMLITASDIVAMHDELGSPLVNGYLLPFLQDGTDQLSRVYGYDLADSERQRVAVYSIHTIVHDWPSQEAFLHWVRTFDPSG